MLGVGLDEFTYLFIYLLFIYANIEQFGFSLFTVMVMSLLK